MKDLILGIVEDLVSNFLYYDRKDDEDLTQAALLRAINSGEVTIDEIVARFEKTLRDIFR